MAECYLIMQFLLSVVDVLNIDCNVISILLDRGNSIYPQSHSPAATSAPIPFRSARDTDYFITSVS